MKKLSWIIPFLLLISAAMYFWVLADSKIRPVFDAVPPETALLIELPETGNVIHKLAKKTSFMPAVLEIDFFGELQANLLSYDSLIDETKVAFRDKLSVAPGILLMFADEDNYGFVVVIQTGKSLKMFEVADGVNRVYGNRAGLITRKFGKYRTATIVDKTKQKQLSYCITDGLLIAGYDRKSFEMVLLQLDQKKSLANDPVFSRMKQAGGKQADALVYLRPAALSSLFKSSCFEDYKKAGADLANGSGQWLASDLLVKEKELLFNGFIYPGESTYLNQLGNHEPGVPKIFSALPFDTRLLLLYSMSNLPSYFARLTDSLSLEALSAHAGVDLNRDFARQIADEIAIGFREGAKDDKIFLAAKLSDAQLVAETLGDLSQTPPNTEVKVVNDLLISTLPKVVFGRSFDGFSQLHWAIEGDVLYMANNRQNVEQLLSLSRKGRTIANNENFKSFSNQLSQSSNILLYGNIRGGLDLLGSFADPQLVYQINRNRNSLESFEAFAMQLSGAGELVYQSFVLKYNPDYQEEGMELWQTPLGAPVSGIPVAIPDPVNGGFQLAAFDESSTLYFLSPQGEILWKKNIAEPVISEVIPLKRGKSNDYWLLFNTSGSIFLLDRKGNNAPGFPVRLKSQATNAVSLGRKANEARILVSCADKTTYSYDLNGRETTAWDRPRSADLVSSKVAQLSAGKLDYVVIADDQGDLRITDSFGKTRISPKAAVNKAKNVAVYLNQTNSKGVLITTNTTGKLVYISGTAALSTTDFGNFSADHFFLYEDFDGNRSMDFIYLDGNKLIVFDRFKKVLFNHEFQHEITIQPRFVTTGKGQRMLCVTDDAGGELYLIDSKGRMLISSNLKGDTPYAVVNLFGNSEIYLVGGSGNKLVCYQVY